MKTQMKFQKYICLVMLVMGALGLLYAFFYLSGSMAYLGQCRRVVTGGSEQFESAFPIVGSEFELGDKNDYKLYERIQPFNNALMYCGIVMLVTAVLLFITASNKRRNYYITNYIATSVCSVSNIVMSLVLMVMNASWKSEFLNVHFDAWYEYNVSMFGDEVENYLYSESTLWFDLGFVVYTLIIVASVLLILNLVWKILLMRGEKKLLSGTAKIEGGATV